MSGLAINGDVVHGVAVGGSALYPLIKNSDGSISFQGQKYSKGSISKGYIPSILGKKASIPQSDQPYYYDAHIKDSDSEDTYLAGHPIIDYFERGNAKLHSIIGKPFVIEIIGEKVVNDTLYVAFAGEEDSQISWALYDDIKPYIQNGGVISPLTHIAETLWPLLKVVITWA